MSAEPSTSVSANAWLNGEIVPREVSAPSIASINLHLGTSVFDGLMAYWNEDHYYLHRAKEHLVRFRQGSERMGMIIPWSVDDLLAGIQQLLELEPHSTQYVRPIAFRRGPELWITGSEGKPVDVSIFTVRVGRDGDELMNCHVSPVERISSRSIPKHTKVSGAYVNSYCARRTAELAGFRDGIMLDREGRLTEASAANFFVIADGQLVTPPLNPEVFPGITRQVVLDLAAATGIGASEEDLRPEHLRDIDGAFLCSTLMEIRGLALIDEIPLATERHPIYRSIVESFRRLTHQ